MLGPRLVTRDLGVVATVPGEVYGKAPSLIARIWRGWTRAEDTEAYAEYILATGMAEYESTPGNRGAYLISRPDGNRTEFLTVSFWDTEDAIVAFAGKDIDQAVFYPEDDRYLVDREITVRHFTVH